MSNHIGLDAETRDMILSALKDFAQKRLSFDLMRELDDAGHGSADNRPEEILREMYGPQFGIPCFAHRALDG